MAAIVHHGLQSCLESQIVESRTLRLKFSSSKLNSSQPIELAYKSCFWDSNSNKNDLHQDNHISTSTPNNGGSSFFQTLSNNVSLGSKETLDKESTYVHPLVTRSSMSLNQRSLELCTENLGNETGTDITENCIDSFSSLDSKGGKFSTREQMKSHQVLGAKKGNNNQNFPPPLTTIRGSESLRVRPHREDGRLIMQAVKVPPSVTCFQADRSHGRLRLSLVEYCAPIFDYEEADIEENEGTNEGYEKEFKIDMNEQRHIVEKVDEEEEEAEETFEDGDKNGVCEGEEIKGDTLNVGAKIEMEKYERLSRCKEGEHDNNVLLNWEALSVATS
ncbi:Fantastic four-like protein [Quillaja saponaria]|uniref:Fantastic four-like protein n=1 Tax=Quillaja saponaria TaxID=32244 RepID=A0AAD7QEN6_QUISA|nr:Fantastic four-like protein [Quillaja saponaria]